MGLKNPYYKRDIVVVGPTASGKTRRAVGLAKRFNGEIISCDSRQVYRDMTLGTGKDLEEYDGVPYHLIDICEAGEKYNLHRFLSDYEKIETKLHNEGKRIVACGGSGMYVESMVSGIRLPEVEENSELRDSLKSKTLEELKDILSSYKTLHNITDVDTAQRAIRAIEIQEYYRKNPQAANRADRKTATPRDVLIIGIDIPSDERRRRISSRLYERLEQGMIQEVQNLLDKGLSPDDIIYYGLEYKFVTLYLIGDIGKDEMIRQLEIAIHQFAKRQMTWFRGMERRGFKINWLDYNLSEESFLKGVENLLNTK